MHMADALLAPAVAATMYAASAVTVGASVKTLKKDEASAKLPTMAVASSFLSCFTEAPTVTAEAAYMVAATAGASNASAICIEMHLFFFRIVLL